MQVLVKILDCLGKEHVSVICSTLPRGLHAPQLIRSDLK